MKPTNQFSTILLLLFLSLSIKAQTGIEAGSNQSVVCGIPVQLYATPYKGWGLIPTVSVNPFNFSSVHFTTEQTGYAVTNRGEVYKTYDAGSFWIPSMQATTNALYTVYFINSSIGFVAGAEGQIYKTINAGDNWTAVTSGTTNSLRSIFFTSPTVGFIVGNSGTILKTTDGGTTWTSRSIVSSNIFHAVNFTSLNNGFICGSNGVLFKTTDGGNNWTQETIVANNPTLYSIHFPNSSIGYISGSLGVIMRTTDGGNNWSKYQADSVYMETEIATPTTARALKTAFFNTIYFTSENTGYAAGSYLSGSIFIKTTDGGMNWFELKNNLPKNTKMTSMCFPNDSTGYAVGNMGRVAKFSTGNIALTNLSWYPSEGLSDPNIANPTANPSTTTTYHVIAPYPQAGRDFTDSVTVTVESLDLSQPAVKYAGCGGSVVLDNYKTNYTGNEKLSYKWTPSTGLSSDNVAYPIAKLTENLTSYNLTISTPGGVCSASTTVIIKDSLVVRASVDKVIVCSGTAQLSSNSNYSGTGNLRYKWTPSTGLNNDTIPNPTATLSSTTTYTVTITSNTGCTASGDVTVSVAALTANAGVDRSVTCGNSLQMNTVTSNYSGFGLRYKWSPTTGLNNDTLPNPGANPTVTTTYLVQITSPTGCTATDNVIVTVNPLTANAGADKTIVCGGTVKLDSVTLNYSGTGKLRYKWTPSTGLNNDTIPNPTSSVTETTPYTVTVTSPFGCSASDNVLVTVTPLTLSVGNDKTVICGQKVQLGVVSTNYSGIFPLKYKWTPSTGLSNDTIANPIATIDAITTFTLVVTSPSGCIATDNVTVNLIGMTKPSINYVGINNENKNILVWTKPSSGEINSFNVYKETNITNSYTKVGSVSIDSAAVFVDEDSNPDVQSNKYKISILDACNSETLLSDFHKTMHLTINKGINTIWNLIWEAYEGFPVSTYNIYRGTTPANIRIIGSLSGSNTQFSDYTAPEGYVYYQIEAVSANVAGIKKYTSRVNSSVEAAYSSRSNIATNKSGIDGLFDLIDISYGLSLYPNPANNFITLVLDDSNFCNIQLYIYNYQGQLLKTHDGIFNQQKIDVSGLSEGLYMIVVKSDKFIGKQKLLIQK